jgi:hypothetical protein
MHMMEQLRREADAAAQSAFHARQLHHERTGEWSPQLTREYRRLQQLVEMIDEHITLTQAEDLDAPILDAGDHFAYPVQ